MTKNFIDSLNGLPIIAGRAKESTSGRDLDGTISLLNATKQNNISGLDPALGDTSMFLNKQGIWVPGPAGETGPTGPCGPVGYIGPQGFCGPVGETGLTGSRGDTGTDGVCGPIGFCGPKGSGGDSGLTGFCGPLGNRGDTGGRGIKGFCGPLGSRGTDSSNRGDTGGRGGTGPRGICGPQGPVGFCGPLGNIGFCGPQGLTGFCGPQGTVNQFSYVVKNYNGVAVDIGGITKYDTGATTLGSSCIIWSSVNFSIKSTSDIVLHVYLYVGDTQYDHDAIYVRTIQSGFFVVSQKCNSSAGTSIKVGVSPDATVTATLRVTTWVFRYT